MHTPESSIALPTQGPVRSRRHRFMESADINAVFREFFAALRRNVRRGLGNEGQLYALEMDACIPGEVLGTAWIPPATRGFDDADRLADARQRRALFERLLAEPRTEALFAYCCERKIETSAETGAEACNSLLYLELVSADGQYAAYYPIVAGEGWHRRELLAAPHARVDLRALA